MLRILSIPFFFYFLINGSKLGIVLILIFGSLSDLLDGYLARKLHAESEIGALLDPIADKLFSNSVLWGLYFLHPVNLQYKKLYLFFASTLTFRDLVLLCGASFVVFKKLAINLRPVFLSKVCTLLIFTFVIFSISFVSETSSFLVEQTGICFGIICILFTLYSFAIYILRFYKCNGN